MLTIARLAHHDGLLTEWVDVDEEDDGDVWLTATTEDAGDPGRPVVIRIPAEMRKKAAAAIGNVPEPRHARQGVVL